MDNHQITTLYKTLEDIRHQNGSEYWFAADLYRALGYQKFEDYRSALERAMLACEKSSGSAADHFVAVKREITDNFGKRISVGDIKLTRYASYLVALNGDPKKPEVAFAQAYFVTQTRKIEVLQQKMEELERLDAREKLKMTDREFTTTIYQRGVSKEGIPVVKSAGDKALFGGQTTDDMKRQYGIIHTKEPLADHLPSVTLIAKNLAMAITTENAKKKDLKGVMPIKNAHVESNRNVREALTKTGIYPEKLPPAKDIKILVAERKKELKALQPKKKRKSIGKAQ